MKGTITASNKVVVAANNTNKKVTLENCAPFNNEKNNEKKNNTQIDNAIDLDFQM